MIRRYLTILTLTAISAFSAYSSGITEISSDYVPQRALQSGIAASAERATVETENRTIIIRNFHGSNSFNIYSVTGQLIKTLHLSGEAIASIDVPKGFYVVKCNSDWSRKVVVR